MLMPMTIAEKFPPEAVAFPIDAEEVKAIVLICNEHNVPLTPRGRGTGTSGGSLPERGGVALSLERMERIVAVDAANRAVVAEPGVINQSLQDSVKPHGYFWPRILPARHTRPSAEIWRHRLGGRMQSSMEQPGIMCWGLKQ